MNFPGSYNIISLKIIKDLKGINPIAYDIRTMMHNLNIYESIFSNTLSGNITIIDTQNLITNIPIMGYEHINIQFKDSLASTSIPLLFKIYKIENIKLESQKSKTYKIHFISEEALTNFNYRISKKYVGTKYTIIKDLMSYITKKNIDIDIDYTQQTVLFPNWNPLKCISFLSNFISYDSKNADFLLWENLFGFRYKSISSLFNKDIKHKLMTNIGMIREDKNQTYTQQMYQAINELSIPSDINDLENIMKGVYGATTYTYDILTATLNKSEYIQENIDNPNNIIFNHQCNNYKYELFAKRNAILNIIKNNTIYVNVPGNQERTTGDNVKVDIISTEENNKLDVKLSGKYIITSICHNFTINKYTQNIGIFK